MIWYRTSKEDDPYRELWSRREWLKPLENPDRKAFPLIITVEPTNVCNLKCLYCSRNLMERKAGFMSMETMDMIAREAEAHNAAIRHGGFGEPLLHPQITDIVAICKRRKILTTIFSNCSFLTKEHMRAFVDLGLDEIRLSSSGVTADEHNTVRRRSNFGRDLEEKIEMAHSIRDQMNSSRPFLTLYTNVLDYGSDTFQENIESYKNRFLPLVDKIDIDLTMLSRVKHLDQVRGLYERQTINETHKPCLTLFLKVIAHWNGDVFACDIAFNFEEEYYLGTLGNEGFTIEQGYNSPKIQRLRKEMSFAMKHENYSLCSLCFSNTTKWDNVETSEAAAGK